MILVIALDIILCVLFLLIFITQILLPLMKGTPLFPMFRKNDRVSKLEAELAVAKSELEAAKLAKDVTRTKAEANKLAAEPKLRTKQPPTDATETDPEPAEEPQAH